MLVIQVLVSLFLAVLFLQSGLDKVRDRQGNLDWLTSHFERSPLAGHVPLLLSAITVLEMGAGLLSAVGAIHLAMTGYRGVAFAGATLAGTALLGLFAGQRLARDYNGAAQIAPYFLVALAALYLLR
jgi:hypothetical protein